MGHVLLFISFSSWKFLPPWEVQVALWEDSQLRQSCTTKRINLFSFLFFSLELSQKSTHYLRFPAVDLWSEDTCTTHTSSWSFFWSRLDTWPSTLRVRGGRGKCYKHCPNRDSHRLPLGQESSVFKGRPKLAWRRRKCVNISFVCLSVLWAESTTENYARA